MTAILVFNTANVFYDRLGAVLNAGTIKSYAGGSATPLATYSDSGLTTPNATTLTMSSSGKLPVNVYISDAVPYRFECTTSGGAPVFIDDQTFPNKFDVNALGTVTKLTNNPLTIMSGTGSPETVVTANVGSLYLRIDGGANTTLYIKESGSGNTGWVAK